MKRVTNVYVDAFNLYYNAVKNEKTPGFKWLDIRKMVANAFPQNAIQTVRYFTAKVQARTNDPQKPQRQELYLRALRTCPNLTIHYGRYVSWPKVMPLTDDPTHRLVKVINTEEKGSDVNLATFVI
ncbi:MAG: NYN domain-containing protein [Chloroflexi bacterium]|nr:NYN domain-containing protein [Chloroflexota bacterium]